MALNLDTRQRAMLQEMGITVWLPQPMVAATAPRLQTTERTQIATAIAPPTQAVAPQAPTPTVRREPAVPTRASAAEAEVAIPAAVTMPAAQWHIAPAVPAYPQAEGGDAEQAWLVIWESANPAAPLSGEVGKLLDNMLRALRLHHHRHVWIAGLQRPGSDALPVQGQSAAPADWQLLQPGLAACLQQTRPARILVLGLHAARAVLGSQEALGRLRAQVHQVHATPVVVSYDPAYLLRSPHAKLAAWTDLCRAHALQPPSAN